MLQALLLLLGALLLFAIAGAPCVKALKLADGQSPHKFWSYSAILGICGITLVLTFLTMLGIPIKILAWIVLVISFCAFAFCFFRMGGYPKIPLLVLAGLLLVIFVISTGYFKMGVFHYKGFNWFDNWGLAAKAQGFVDYGGLRTAEEFDNSLLAGQGGAYHHRITNSVIVAYLASIFMQPTASLLGVIMLLCPIFFYLLIISFSEHSKSLGAIIIAVTCAWMPGINILSAEGFMGASTFSYMLLAFVIFYNKLLECPKWEFGIACFLTFWGTHFSYSEASMLLYGVMIIMLVWRLLLNQKKKFVKIFIYSMTILVLNFLAGLPFFKEFSSGFRVADLGTTSSLHGVYPFAKTAEAMCTLFFGFIPSNYETSYEYKHFIDKAFNINASGDLSTLFTVLSILGTIAFLFGLMGLFAQFLKKRDSLSLALLALSISPFVFLGASSWYQYYRSLSMVCPLYLYGLWSFVQDILEIIREGMIESIQKKGTKTKETGIRNDIVFKIVKTATAGLLILVCLFQGYSTAFHLSLVDQYITRNYFLPQKQGYEQREQLEKMSEQNLLIFGSGGDTRLYWIYYYARKNNIWVAHPSMAVKRKYPSNPNTKPICFNYGEIPALSYENMPEDVQLIWVDGGSHSFLTDKSLSSEIGAVVVDTNLEAVILGYGENQATDSLALVSYAKSDYEGAFILNLRNESGDETVETFPVHLSKGWNRYEMKLDSALIPYTWELDISE